TTILKKWLIDTLLTNAVALLIVRFVLNIQTGLIPEIYATNFAYKYLALALGIGLGLNILKAGFQGAIFLEKAENKTKTW
ncbi:LTA synthase family protein, partial [Shigella sonnei]|nr:LTA synthase family protein [Shigella sonnei]